MRGAVNERLTAALADRYRIERELGQGGMAMVYLGPDLRHDRDVAIKVLPPGTLYYSARQIEANIWLVKRASPGAP